MRFSDRGSSLYRLSHPLVVRGLLCVTAVSFCYLLVVASGSSVDRQSNNVSLFGLIEQVNVRPGQDGPPRGVLPVEIHAYLQLAPEDRNRDFEMRLVLAADTGLETFGEAFRNRASTSRFRVRSVGLPYPPVLGDYTVRIDFRLVDPDELPWERQAAAWPLSFREVEARPAVTH